ncbi:MAG TPA: NAD-dependent deacylase [Tepidisphaeraceae bacterium]|nr:NAD-dependent deacylase [Tepidisphaeraceae bacterium]
MDDAQDSLARARRLIAAAQQLVVFTGAGVSADSGVPTFRGHSGESFWGKYDAAALATPQGFRANPQLVYDWYSWRRSQLVSIQPNAAHRAIARWQETKGAIVVTQNIDGLHEELAPLQATVLRLHGSLAADRCSGCGYRETIDLHNLPKLRGCPQCGELMRPDVVWFGEELDEDVWGMAEQAARNADVMLVVGTSGEVWPAVGLVHLAARRGDVIIANLEPGPLEDCATVVLHGRAAEVIPKLAADAL